MHQKLFPDPYLILLYNLTQPQPLHARNSFKNKTFWKSIIRKPSKSFLLFFLLNPVPFNGQSYEKQKESGTSDQLLFRLQNKIRKIILFITLSDQVWRCNVKQFSSYSKNYICKFMQTNSCYHKLFQFHFSFWVWKLWKGREKSYKNLNLSRMKLTF